MNDVVMVGAGLSGLACARDLQRAGTDVLLLDKSRGVSGRSATRRWDGVRFDPTAQQSMRLDPTAQQSMRLDHGAQYFTSRGERLSELARGWEQEGWLRVWSHGFPLWKNGEVTGRPPGRPRYAPPAGMSALGRHLARDLSVVTEAPVSSLSRMPGGWRVHVQDGRAFEAAAVLLSLPAPQLAPLLDALPLGDAGMDLDRVRFEPTWTLLLELERDLDVSWPALESEHEVVRLVSRDHTKRWAGAPPTLVVHAAGGWSRDHLEDGRETVERAMLSALREVVGDFVPRRAQVHRWRFATPTVFFPRACHWDPALRLGWCGDWCAEDPRAGAKVEGALKSGWSLAALVGS